MERLRDAGVKKKRVKCVDAVDNVTMKVSDKKTAFAYWVKVYTTENEQMWNYPNFGFIQVARKYSHFTTRVLAALVMKITHSEWRTRRSNSLQLFYTLLLSTRFHSGYCDERHRVTNKIKSEDKRRQREQRSLVAVVKGECCTFQLCLPIYY